MVDSRFLTFSKGPAGAPRIFKNVLNSGRLWDCEQTGMTRKKVQRHLSGSTVVPLAHFSEDPATRAVWRGKVSMCKRAVTDNGDLVLGRVRKKSMANNVLSFPARPDPGGGRANHGRDVLSSDLSDRCEALCARIQTLLLAAISVDRLSQLPQVNVACLNRCRTLDCRRLRRWLHRPPVMGCGHG